MKYVLEITPQGCGEMFSEYGEHTTDDTILYREPHKVALVVFTGGSDVTPELYGENKLPCTYNNIQRDLYEGRMFELAEEAHIPIVGICRGSQFLCVKAGGKLVQDISGHGTHHKLRTSDGRLMVCNSSHHQMQLPGKDAVPLAWSEGRRSKRYLNGDGDNIDVDREYEVVHYPNIRAVGCQFHPEWIGCPKESVDYALEVVRKHLFDKVVA